VPGCIQNTNGKIGFWGYTVVEELVVPEPAAIRLAGCGLAIVGFVSSLRRRRAVPMSDQRRA
jgi:hypothetical protein